MVARDVRWRAMAAAGLAEYSSSWWLPGDRFSGDDRVTIPLRRDDGHGDWSDDITPAPTAERSRAKLDGRIPTFGA
jgi:hypothetical protein